MLTSPLSRSTWKRYQPIVHMNVTATVSPSKPTCTCGRPSCSLVSAILCGTRLTLSRSTPRCRSVSDAAAASASAADGAGGSCGRRLAGQCAGAGDHGRRGVGRGDLAGALVLVFLGGEHLVRDDVDGLRVLEHGRRDGRWLDGFRRDDRLVAGDRPSAGSPATASVDDDGLDDGRLDHGRGLERRLSRLGGAVRPRRPAAAPERSRPRAAPPSRRRTRPASRPRCARPARTSRR